MFVLLAVVMSLVAVQAVWAEDFIPISIALSPRTIVLGNNAEGNCGIHTNISYSLVDITEDIVLSNLANKSVIVDKAKSDSNGYLIVQVSLDKVQGLVSSIYDDYNGEIIQTTLILSGYTVDGEPYNGAPFLGSDIINIIRLEE